MPAPIAWNRSPLPENRFAPLPLGAVCLEGDAREKLKAERGGDDEERLCRAFLLADEGEQHEVVRRLKDKLEKEDGVRLTSLRALMRLHGALNDASVAQALLETLKRYYDAMQDSPALGADSAALAADLTQTALWLYNLTGNKALLTLCAKLRAQGPDWTSLLHTFPQTRPVRELLTEEDPAYWRADGQTLAAALRACGLRALYEGGLKNETAFQAAWRKLSRYHGAAHGLFNAEPLLAGANPARGVLCGVTEELARSLETLQWTLGAPECGDAAERVFYNALCAPGRKQQANQLEQAQGNGPAAMAIAASGMWMAARDGLAAFGYAPCRVKWVVNGVPVRVEVAPGYPESETVTLRVRVKEPATLRLYLRVPAWAEGAVCAVAGEETPMRAGGFHVLEREWKGEETVTLRLPAAVRTEKGYHQSLSVVRGAVTYALPVEAGARWNYALLPERGFEWNEGEDAVYAWAAPVPEWTEFEAMPVSPHVSAAHAERIKLVPYGKTCARVAQFPAGVAE